MVALSWIPVQELPWPKAATSAKDTALSWGQTTANYGGGVGERDSNTNPFGIWYWEALPALESPVALCEVLV